MKSSMISNPPQRAHTICVPPSINAELPFLALSQANLVPFEALLVSLRQSLEIPMNSGSDWFVHLNTEGPGP